MLLDVHVSAGTRFSLRDKRLFEINEFEITGVNCIVSPTRSVSICLISSAFIIVVANSCYVDVSVLQKIPDITCDHCVIRARYNAHKPGEQIFYQCSDVMIKSPSTNDALKFEPKIPHGKEHLPLHRMKALRSHTSKKHAKRFAGVSTMLYGLAFNPFDQDRSHYVDIDPVTGVTNVLNTFDMGIDSSTYRNMSNGRLTDEKVGHFFVDEIVSIDYGRNTSNFLVHTSPSRDAPATRMMIMGTMNGSMVEHAELFQFNGSAINGMSWYTFGVSVAFRLQPAEKDGKRFFNQSSNFHH